MAQTKPVSSRAIAAVTTLAGLPVRASLRYRAQPQLRLPGDLADRLGLALLPEQQLAADPRREAVTPGGLYQQPAGGAVAGLGKTAAFDARSTRMLGRHQPEIRHQLARIGEAREVAQLGDQRRRIDQ